MPTGPGARGGHRAQPWGTTVWGPAGELKEQVEVDQLGGLLGEAVEGADGVGALGGRDQPEVARRGADPGVARQDTEHRQAGGLDTRAHLMGVARRPRLVEDDADDVDGRIEGPQPVQGGRDRAGSRRDVGDEDDRGAREGGQVGGRREAAGADPSVEQAHHPFYDCHVGGRGGPGPVEEERDDEFLGGQPGVEVATGTPGGERVIAGVDVVRADLGRGHDVTGPGQGGHDADGDGRLALSRCRCRDDDPGQPGRSHHSMPFWPFWPLSKGCAILVISVATSAISRRRGCGSRPVMTTCW